MSLFVRNRHDPVVEGAMLHWLYAPTPQHFVVALNDRLPILGHAGIPGKGMRGKEQSTTRPYNAFKGGRYASGMATQGMHIQAAMPASANLACQSRRLLWAA